MGGWRLIGQLYTFWRGEGFVLFLYWLNES